MQDVIANFVRTLHRGGLKPDTWDVLDALWLSLHMPPPEARPSVASPISNSADSVEPGPNNGLEISSAENKSQQSQESNWPFSLSKESSVLTVPCSAESEAVIPVSPIRIPAGSALPEALNIVRALRHIPAGLPSRTAKELDEDATVNASAEALGQLMPIFRPVQERWYEAALVVEHTPSMDIWSQTTIEIERMLRYLGAFRDVRIWRLRTGRPSYLVRDSGATANLKTLCDPEARRIVFLFSHAVSSAWSDGSVALAIATWGRTTPVVLIHALPTRMWANTLLGEPSGLVSTRMPGGPNTELKVEQSFWDLEDSFEGTVPLPVFSLSAHSAQRWAQAIMSRHNCTAPSYFLAIQSRTNPVSPKGREELTPEQRVNSFKNNSTPEAFRLAVHLAAGPLTVPVIHLVQTAVFSDRASQSHVAEVMLSGLVERVTPVNASVAPDQVQFRFDPAARRILLRSLRKEDALDLTLRLQQYIEGNFSSPRDFQSWLSDPKGKTLVSAAAEPFALMRSEFLDWLGLKSLPVPVPEQQGVPPKPRIRMRDEIQVVIVFDEGQLQMRREVADWLIEIGVPTNNVHAVLAEPERLKTLIQKLSLLSGSTLILFWASLNAVAPPSMFESSSLRGLLFFNSPQLHLSDIFTGGRKSTLIQASGKSSLWPLIRSIGADVLLDDEEAFFDQLDRIAPDVHYWTVQDEETLGKLHGFPPRQNYFRDHKELKATVLKSLKKLRIAIIKQPPGMRRLCTSIALDDEVRKFFVGGIFWKPSTKDLLGSGRRLYIASTSAFSSFTHDLRPGEHWLLYKSGKPSTQSQRYQELPSFNVPLLTEKESLRFLQDVSNFNYLHLQALFTVHQGNLLILDYLAQQIVHLNPVELLLRVQRVGDRLLKLENMADRLQELIEDYSLPLLSVDMRRGLDLIAIAYKKELPVELAKHLEISSESLQALRLIRHIGNRDSLSVVHQIELMVRNTVSGPADLHRLIITKSVDLYGWNREVWRVHKYLRQSRIYHLAGALEFEAAADQMMRFEWLTDISQLDGPGELLADLDLVRSKYLSIEVLYRLFSRELSGALSDKRKLSEKELANILTQGLQETGDRALRNLFLEAARVADST